MSLEENLESVNLAGDFSVYKNRYNDLLRIKNEVLNDIFTLQSNSKYESEATDEEKLNIENIKLKISSI